MTVIVLFASESNLTHLNIAPNLLAGYRQVRLVFTKSKLL